MKPTNYLDRNDVVSVRKHAVPLVETPKRWPDVALVAISLFVFAFAGFWIFEALLF